MIYLDYAAATPLDDRVLQAMVPYWQEQFFNPSATYLAGKAVAKDLQAARQKVAGVLAVLGNGSGVCRTTRFIAVPEHQ